MHHIIPTSILKTLHLPTVHTEEMAVYPFGKGADINEAVDLLCTGHYVLLTHAYPDGLKLLHALKQRIGNTASSFEDKREKRKIYQSASQKLLVEVEAHHIALKKAPDIPFLEMCYPQKPDFVISYPDVQGLNSAWQWYVKGLALPGLQGKLHPFYGVYFPTRFEHIELFNSYLQEHPSAIKQAIEVGVGSGVLSLLLLQAGVSHIQATDCNPNALYSSAMEMQRRDVADRVHLIKCDLMTACEGVVDLILFNPPWLEAKHPTSLLDQAIYYPKGLFERFFAQADDRLSAKGKIVLLFSQLGQNSAYQKQHPITHFLQNNPQWEVCVHLTKQCRIKKTKGWRQRQANEVVELWEIKRSR